MNRIPQAKSQATILVREMKAAGIPIKHQQALEMVAKMSGFRDWNAMSGAPTVDEAPAATPNAGIERQLARLVDLANNVISNSDNTGCDDDLTVTSESSVAAMEKFIQKLSMPESVTTNSSEDDDGKISIIWSVGDIFEIRPDLTRTEAMEVLHTAKRRHDANEGINWDILHTHAVWMFQERKLPCTITFADDEGRNLEKPAVVNLARKAKVYIDGKPLSEFTSSGEGEVRFEALPEEEYPVEDGRLFADEESVARYEVTYAIQALLEKLEKADALPKVSSD
jgi:hypothetical protein